MVNQTVQHNRWNYSDQINVVVFRYILGLGYVISTLLNKHTDPKKTSPPPMESYTHRSTEEPIQSLYYLPPIVEGSCDGTRSVDDHAEKSSRLYWMLKISLLIILILSTDSLLDRSVHEFHWIQSFLVSLLFFALSSVSLLFSLILISSPEVCLSLADDREGIIREELRNILYYLLYLSLLVFVVIWLVSAKTLYQSFLSFQVEWCHQFFYQLFSTFPKLYI